MNFSKLFFDKDLYDLTYKDISNFFLSQQEESLYLEFKSYVEHGKDKDKVDAVKKAICGMLNSEGGLVIWGAPKESKDANGNTFAKGALTPFESKLDKDRLVNVICSAITPMPTDIKVYPLESKESKFIFIFEIQKSITRPHQFSNRYFIRLDGQTRIAPHYLISALFKSIDFPNLNGHIRLKNINTDGENFILSFKRVLFNRSEYINELNPQWKLLVYNGQLIIDKQKVSSPYTETKALLSHNSPFISSFQVKIPSNKFHENFDIILQFGGEKSPMKMSIYTYSIKSFKIMGKIVDETKYLVSKNENELPSITSKKTYEEAIELLLK